MSDQTSNTFTSTFFIVPSYIMFLPGITLGFLKVYETIFQFWNHNKPCFLSEDSLCERTELGRSQVYEALSYFENLNELIRVKKKGTRYFIRPIKDLETDCTENIPTSGAADEHVRRSGLSTSGAADYNKKNINKENKCVGANATNTQASSKKSQKELVEYKALNNESIQTLFREKFSGLDITLEQLFSACKEHYEQKSLWATCDKFLKWIKSEKIENYKKSDSKNQIKETDEQRMERYRLERERNKRI